MTRRTVEWGNGFCAVVAALALGCAHQAPPSARVQPAPVAVAAPPPTATPPAAFRGPEEELAVWNAHHPEAARELCQWVRHHEQAAHLFFEWDAQQPERSHELVSWTLSHPGQDLDAFLGGHPGGSGFDPIARDQRPAAEAFIEWVRRHPVAAERLSSHPQGLAWAGNHLAC